MGKGLRATRCRCRGPSLALHSHFTNEGGDQPGSVPFDRTGRTQVDITVVTGVPSTGTSGTRIQRGIIRVPLARMGSFWAWPIVVSGHEPSTPPLRGCAHATV